MARKLVICASSSHLTAAVWTGRRLESMRSFQDHEEDHQSFAALLGGMHGMPAFFMVDTIDEDYRFETLPHTTGKDRKDMVERKLKQLYRSTPLFGANLIEREKTKRRDDRYLLAALTNPESFDVWLRILTASGLPIAGVFPLPMVSVALVKKLGLTESNLLLVSKHESGVRQTFIKDQRFRISRLTPLQAGGNRIETCAEEIRNTRMYLDALNVTHVDDVMHIIVLDQDGSLSTLGETVLKARRRNMRTVHVPPGEIVAKVGVDRASLEASADALHLFLLGQQKTLDFNLAPPVSTSGYTRHLLGRGLYATSGGVGLLSVLWCLVSLYQAFSLSGDAQAIADRTRDEQARYQELVRTFPPSPLPPEKLQLTVDTAGRIEGLARLPDATFQVVSQALQEYPGIKLLGIDWKHGRVGAAGNSGTPTPLSQSAILQMEMTAQPGDIRGTLSTINGLVREMEKSPSVAEVKVSKMPVNFASTGNLRGSTTNVTQEQPQAAKFDVELVLKPGV